MAKAMDKNRYLALSACMLVLYILFCSVLCSLSVCIQNESENWSRIVYVRVFPILSLSHSTPKPYSFFLSHSLATCSSLFRIAVCILCLCMHVSHSFCHPHTTVCRDVYAACLHAMLYVKENGGNKSATFGWKCIEAPARARLSLYLSLTLCLFRT